MMDDWINDFNVPPEISWRKACRKMFARLDKWGPFVMSRYQQQEHSVERQSGSGIVKSMRMNGNGLRVTLDHF